jgi:hypothetical protein
MYCAGEHKAVTNIFSRRALVPGPEDTEQACVRILADAVDIVEEFAEQATPIAWHSDHVRLVSGMSRCSP